MYKSIDSKLLYLILLIFWYGLIIHISSIPHLSVSGYGFPIRKLGHIFVYFILTILFWKNIFWIKSYSIEKAIICFIVVFAFAIFDEIHQSIIPGRHGNIKGVFIDMLGVLPVIGWCFAMNLLRSK
jgi:VanZ family protein